MDIRTIKKLIELAKESEIAELEVDGEKERVRITVHNKADPAVHNVLQSAPIPQIKLQNDTTQQQNQQDLSQSAQILKTLPQHTTNSPMVGTVYLSASPGTKPFVTIGQQVKVGDVVCLIEAMKMFNRIEADKDGIIKEVLIKNGQPVEFSQPLFVIE